MIIEIIITILLAIIFYIYLKNWPESSNLKIAANQEDRLLKSNNKEDKKIEKAAEVIKQVDLPVSDNAEVIELVEKANDYFNQEDWPKAEKFYLKAASLDAKCVKAYSRLGLIYLKSGKDWQDAEEAFSQALKLDPKNGYILNNLGLSLYNQEKYDQAIECFEKSIKADNQQSSRYANLGIAYFAKRQFTKAERALKKAVGLDPDNHEYHNLLKEATEKKKTHQTLIR